jgi:hypothetical protein
MCRCDGRDLRPVALCSLGCGLSVRVVLTREQAVVSLDGDPERWWSWLTHNAQCSSIMLERRLLVLDNFEGACPCVVWTMR